MEEDCAICLVPTTERSKDLFLYNCQCIYAIHANCFREWRLRTETSRICLICREGLETFETNRVLVVQQQHVVQRHVVLRPVPAPRQQNYNNTNKNLFLAGLFVLFMSYVFRLFLAPSQQMYITPPPPLRPLGGENRLLL
jgi:hypothetical protein